MVAIVYRRRCPSYYRKYILNVALREGNIYVLYAPFNTYFLLNVGYFYSLHTKKNRSEPAKPVTY